MNEKGTELNITGDHNSTIIGDYNIIGNNNRIEINETLLRELLSTISSLRSELNEIRQDLREMKLK